MSLHKQHLNCRRKEVPVVVAAPAARGAGLGNQRVCWVADANVLLGNALLAA